MIDNSINLGFLKIKGRKNLFWFTLTWSQLITHRLKNCKRDFKWSSAIKRGFPDLQQCASLHSNCKSFYTAIKRYFHWDLSPRSMISQRFKGSIYESRIFLIKRKVTWNYAYSPFKDDIMSSLNFVTMSTKLREKGESKWNLGIDPIQWVPWGGGHTTKN